MYLRETGNCFLWWIESPLRVQAAGNRVELKADGWSVFKDV